MIRNQLFYFIFPASSAKKAFSKRVELLQLITITVIALLLDFNPRDENFKYTVHAVKEIFSYVVLTIWMANAFLLINI